ncbi:MAG: DsrE family protein [Thermodesulfobacteriota bacterium]
MTNHIVIVLSCGTDNPNRSTRGLFLAMAAHKEGKQATLFLLDEGVYLARKGIIDHLRAATGDIADDHLSYLQANGVPILVCTPCAAARRIGEADLVEGARMATAAELIRLSCEASVISL